MKLIEDAMNVLYLLILYRSMLRSRVSIWRWVRLCFRWWWVCLAMRDLVLFMCLKPDGCRCVLLLFWSALISSLYVFLSYLLLGCHWYIYNIYVHINVPYLQMHDLILIGVLCWDLKIIQLHMIYYYYCYCYCYWW